MKSDGYESDGMKLVSRELPETARSGRDSRGSSTPLSPLRQAQGPSGSLGMTELEDSQHGTAEARALIQTGNEGFLWNRKFFLSLDELVVSSIFVKPFRTPRADRH